MSARSIEGDTYGICHKGLIRDCSGVKGADNRCQSHLKKHPAVSGCRGDPCEAAELGIWC